MKKSVLCIFVATCMLHGIFINAQPLSGNYTIGAGGNYTNIDEAITALQNNGISSSVVFHLTDALYESQLNVFPPINGSSPSKTIKFRGNNNTVVKPSSGIVYGNIFWELTGGNYEFANLTFDFSQHSYFSTIELSYNNSNAFFQVDSCRFLGSYSIYGDLNSAINNTNSSQSLAQGTLIIRNSYFENLGRAIMFYTNNPLHFLHVKNNTILDNDIAIQVYNGDSVIIEENTIERFNRGINLSPSSAPSSYNKLYVKNNRIYNPTFQQNTFGLLAGNMDMLYVFNNQFYNLGTAAIFQSVENISFDRQKIVSCYEAMKATNFNVSYVADNSVTYRFQGFTFENSNSESLTFSGNTVLVDSVNYNPLARALRIKSINHIGGFYNPMHNNILEGVNSCLSIELSNNTHFELNTLSLRPVQTNNSLAVFMADVSNSRFNFNNLYIDSIGLDGISTQNSAFYSLLSNTNVSINQNGYYMSAQTGNYFSIEDFAATDLAQFQNVSPFDSESKFANPNFYHVNKLYEPTNPLLVNTINNNTGTNVDIYGRMRAYGYPGAVEGNYWDASILENQTPLAVIFPNPASEYITVQSHFVGKFRLSFIDMYGRKVAEICCANESGTNPIFLPPSIHSGFYTLLLEQGNKSETKRIAILK